MLATSPNHPIISGTTPEVTNRIEYESVPIVKKICANAKTEFFVLRILQPKSINEFFSAPFKRNIWGKFRGRFYPRTFPFDFT